MDCTLYLFGADGRKRKEIQSWIIVPPNKTQPAKRARIAWCRSDRNGKGYVVGVGGDGGRGVGWISPEGNHRLLSKPAESWQLCYPRDLEPKGLFTCRFVPSDDEHFWLTREEDGHGPLVGFPTFHLDKLPKHCDTSWHRGGVMIPNGGERFGFWARSHDSFITVATRETNGTSESPVAAAHANTWFFNVDGDFTGWIAAEEICDGAIPGSLLFTDASGKIETLDKDLHVTDLARFQWADGSSATPYKLFADLNIGFFTRGEYLVLANW
jgi:hypothetical protein